MADESGLRHGKLRRDKALHELPDALRAFLLIKLRESTEKDAADVPEGTELLQLAEISQKLGLAPAVGLQEEELSGAGWEIFSSGQFEETANVSADEGAGHVGALEEMVWEMEKSV